MIYVEATAVSRPAIVARCMNEVDVFCLEEYTKTANGTNANKWRVYTDVARGVGRQVTETMGDDSLHTVPRERKH
jgi:hypothetical protein